jgi:predicted RNA-binding Zn ribbon-like protein
MSFRVDHWFTSRFAIYATDGMLLEVPLYRAIDTKARKPVLLLSDRHFLLLAWRMPPGGNDGVIPLVTSDSQPRFHAAFDYMPGVALGELIAQAREAGGEMPLEAAAHIVSSVARAVFARRASYLQPVSSERIRICFDGRALFFAQLRGVPDVEDDFELTAIRVLPQPRYMRRTLPPEPGIAPEEADPEYTRDMRAEVFRLGALLHILLDNAHPFEADHPLEQLESLQLDRRHPLRRDVSNALREVVTRALSHEPSDRFADPGALADALDAALPGLRADGVSATRALACGMFPRLREEQLAELEQIEMIDWAELISDAPTLNTDSDVITRNVRPPPERRTRMVFRVGNRSVAADNRLVTNGEVVEFLNATQRPDPPQFVGRIEELADEPALLIGPADAAAFAAWRNGRLPTEEEWVAMVSLLTVPDVTRVWEWTSTPARTGFVVRGGPWRNRAGAGRVDNRSWEDEPGVDVGFRVFYDPDSTRRA